jgi:hypothetical protein
MLSSESLGGNALSKHHHSKSQLKPTYLKPSSRWNLQEFARSILTEFGEDHRLKHCMKTVLSSGVYINHGEQFASFGGIQTCGNWNCPICSKKKARASQKEYLKLMKAALKQGKHVYMLTLTFAQTTPVLNMMPLEQVLAAFFKQDRAFRALKQKLGINGRITSKVPLLTNNNGYHLHIHILLFTDNPIEHEEKDTLKKRWVNVCFKYGLVASFEHGLKIQEVKKKTDAEKVSSYVANQNTKNIHSVLERAYHAHESGNEKESKFLKLSYIELLQTTKGKRLHLISSNLRKNLGIKAKSRRKKPPFDQTDLTLQQYNKICSLSLQDKVLQASTMLRYSELRRYIDRLIQSSYRRTMRVLQ